MASQLVQLIISPDEQIRHQSLDRCCQGASLDQLTAECAALDDFRRSAPNLYEQVRALMFLAAIYRYHLPPHLSGRRIGKIPYRAYQHVLERRFGEALDGLLAAQRERGPSEALASGLAHAYQRLAFQRLADQVRRSVRTVRGNQWMFRTGHTADHPLRLHPKLLERNAATAGYPVLTESTAVRMDFSHSAWSDIFFLGMDYPEGARVVNCSVDLGVHGRDPRPRPPIESYLRVIDRPVLRLVSVDLAAWAELTQIEEVFDFGRDHLGLLKAAVVAAGIIPPGLDGSQQSLAEVFARMIAPGSGLELVSKVNAIPKGSRLAVSTNLLGSLITICMRATHQIGALTGGLSEPDRRIVAARAILGEWLGGSGGGWQDSGGIWPGIKLIQGVVAQPGDAEYGISRGRLLPDHSLFDAAQVSAAVRGLLQDSLVLVHGGMSQNVGPILEMVTEKYLLRCPAEWEARQQAIHNLDELLGALHDGHVQKLAAITTSNFRGPLQTIIPAATNLYTDLLIQRCEQQYAGRFWGFCMLGGMSGGGMGFFFDPACRAEAQAWLVDTMRETSRRLAPALPFATLPVAYDFALNDRGSWADLRTHSGTNMPDEYYGLLTPVWLRADRAALSPQAREELEHLGAACRSGQASENLSHALLERLLPQRTTDGAQQATLAQLLERFGFDAEHHEQIRADLRSGRIGLAQNRLPRTCALEDVRPSDVRDLRAGANPRWHSLGEQALRAGSVAVVTLAAGAGSRWTEGAGVVKALHPFAKLAGRHRNFLEVHLAKSRLVSRRYDVPVTHIFTTGYLTDGPIREHLAERQAYGYEGPVVVSLGRSVGLRLIPTLRDLKFLWEETQQQVLDEQQQRLRGSIRAALQAWAQAAGEAEDYTDNVPSQCLHPVGHWYEIPNLLKNGVLADLLRQQPQLRTLLLSNVDTLGASLDPQILGAHLEGECCLSFEVIPKRFDDRGGGLARVDGKVRIVEGLSLPRDEDEFELSFYNSMTTWINVDRFSAALGLTRERLQDAVAVEAAVRKFARRMPTYITLKDVKKRWGQGQEDVFPVAQFERLWGDMTTLPELRCDYFLTDLRRGQQLKQQSQLDAWLRDGSAAYVRELCAWGPSHGGSEFGPQGLKS